MVLKMSMSFTRSMAAQSPSAGSKPTIGDVVKGSLASPDSDRNQRDRGDSTASSSSSCSSFMDEIGLEDERMAAAKKNAVLTPPSMRGSVVDGLTPALIEISLAKELEDCPTQSDLEAIDEMIESAKDGDLPTFTRLCELLKRRHITADCAGYMGWTSAHWAAREGHIHILDYLSQQHVNLDVLDKKGDSLLHKAAANGQFRTCQWLLQHGFNVQSRNNNGQTPLDVAQELKAIAKTNESALCEAILAHENAHTF